MLVKSAAWLLVELRSVDRPHGFCIVASLSQVLSLASCDRAVRADLSAEVEEEDKQREGEAVERSISNADWFDCSSNLFSLVARA